MATALGVHAHRLASVRALRSPKGRREQDRFAFEGATLLEEACAAGYPIEEIYATQAAHDATPLVRELDAHGIRTFIVEAGSAANISDLTTPSGIVAVAPIRLQAVEEIFNRSGPALVLADINDPANAGTLLRSADAFGCRGVVFGRHGVDPYHPKVVRGSMGAVFRLPMGVAEPAGVAAAAAAAGLTLLGLSAHGAPLFGEDWSAAPVLVVGNERHGLGRWEALCERVLAIPMAGRAESLSAGVAGSIALYEATRRLLPNDFRESCQESASGPKSQDYRR